MKRGSIAFKAFSVATLITGISPLLIGTAYAGTSLATDAPPVSQNGSWVQVSTPQQLEYIDRNQSHSIAQGSTTTYLGANIELMNNIDLSGYTSWVPFGTSGHMFAGTFNGQGRVISGLTMSDTTDAYVGVFGMVTGDIENLGVSASVHAGTNQYTGLLVGAQEGGSMTHVFASGTLTAGSSSINGGLIGYEDNNPATNSNSYTDVAITSGSASTNGGIVGFQNSGFLNSVYAVGKIAGPSSLNGGIAGDAEGNNSVVGIASAYFDRGTTETTVGIAQGGSAVPFAEPTVAMHTQSTYSGWDFTSTWGIAPNINNGYPYLRDMISSSMTPVTASVYSEQKLNLTGSVSYGQTPLSGQTVTLSVPNGDGTWSNGSTIHTVSTDFTGAYSDTWTAPQVTTSTSVILTSAVNSSVQQTSAIQVQPLTLAGVPTDLGHTNVTSNSWAETWSSVVGSGAGTVTYQVYLNKLLVATTPATFYDFSGKQPGTTYNVTIASVNGAGKVSVQSPIDDVTTPLPVLPLSVGTHWAWNGQYGVPYNALQLQATSGQGPYTWAVTGGSLPSGLHLSSDGVLSGIPNGENGTSAFTVKVTDATGATASGNLSVVIFGAPSVSIGTTTLPVAKEGLEYSASFVGSGVGPLNWTLRSGNLPTGVTLNPNGTLSGSPRENGPFTFTVQVTDRSGSQAERFFTLDIAKLSADQRILNWHGQTEVVPAVVKQNTTYMSIWYLMQSLKTLGIESTWDGQNWNLITSNPQAPGNVLPGQGAMHIRLNGTVIANLNGVYATDPSTGRMTTYMPIGRLMQVLNKAGLQSTWDGTTWTLGQSSGASTN